MSASPGTGPAQFGNLESNLRFLDQIQVLRPGLRVLEVGCGTGTLLHQLRSKGCEVCGVEVSPALIAEGRRWYGPLPIVRISGTALPFGDGGFDVVVSFDVFEHIRDSDAHLREVRRVLRPQGRYLLQTPNKWTNVVFETIRWRSFTRFREDHCSLHSLAGLRRRLARHGFETQPCDVPVVNAFFKAKVKRHLGWPGLAALGVLNPDRLPLALRTNLYVSARRLDEVPASR